MILSSSSHASTTFFVMPQTILYWSYYRLFPTTISFLLQSGSMPRSILPSVASLFILHSFRKSLPSNSHLPNLYLTPRNILPRLFHFNSSLLFKPQPPRGIPPLSFRSILPHRYRSILP